MERPVGGEDRIEHIERIEVLLIRGAAQSLDGDGGRITEMLQHTNGAPAMNVGTYRVMVHDRRHTDLYISPGKHGRIHRDKSFERGEPMPAAVVVGMAPLLFVASCLEMPPGTKVLCRSSHRPADPGPIRGGPRRLACIPTAILPAARPDGPRRPTREAALRSPSVSPIPAQRQTPP